MSQEIPDGNSQSLFHKFKSGSIDRLIILELGYLLLGLKQFIPIYFSLRIATCVLFGREKLEQESGLLITVDQLTG